MTSTFIHLGLPKAGSTSLQSFFEKQVAFNYLGKRVPNRYGFVDPSLFSLIRENVVYGHSVTNEIRERALGLLSNDQPNVLSDELLSGVGFHNFKSNEFPPLEPILQRLNEVFDMPQFIVVLREQFSLLRSYYRQLLRVGYSLTYAGFAEAVLNGKFGILDRLSYADFCSNVLNYKSKIVFFEKLFLNNRIDVDYLGSAFDSCVELKQVSQTVENRSNATFDTIFNELSENRETKRLAGTWITDDEMIEDAKNFANVKQNKNCFYCPLQILEALKQRFEIQNEKLTEILATTIPQSYLENCSVPG